MQRGGFYFRPKGSIKCMVACSSANRYDVSPWTPIPHTTMKTGQTRVDIKGGPDKVNDHRRKWSIAGPNNIQWKGWCIQIYAKWGLCWNMHFSVHTFFMLIYDANVNKMLAFKLFFNFAFFSDWKYATWSAEWCKLWNRDLRLSSRLIGEVERRGSASSNAANTWLLWPRMRRGDCACGSSANCSSSSTFACCCA